MCPHCKSDNVVGTFGHRGQWVCYQVTCQICRTMQVRYYKYDSAYTYVPGRDVVTEKVATDYP